MKSGIYCILNIVNNKVYIGSSKNIQSRIKTHKKNLRTKKHENKYLQSSWDKYGESMFYFFVLEICPEELLIDKEKEWIKIKGALSRDKGYNIFEPREYIQRKSSQKDKMLFCINKETKHIEEFSSPTVLCIERGWKYDIALEVLAGWAKGGGKKKSIQGYILVYKKDYIEGFDYFSIKKPDYPKFRKSKKGDFVATPKKKPTMSAEESKIWNRETFGKPIIFEKIDTGEIFEFPAIKTAAKQLNLKLDKIHKCLNAEYRKYSHHGYYMKRKELP